jgi:flagellar M-ring protein FliF
MPSFLQNILSLPAKTKALLGVSTFAVLAIAFVMLKVATAPSYSLMSTGLDPAQTGKVTAALDAQGIAYEIQSNGTALAVQKSQMAQARIALAGAGVDASGSGSQPGYELLDQSKLGSSQFQQQVTYQRALEGEIARTLNGVEGVSGATVQIVMPQDDLFEDTATPATAAVMLQNSADTLQPGAVRGIAQLTSSSVKGLKTDNVTITDGSGQLLWPTGDGSTGGTGGATKQAAEGRYDRQLETQLNALLVQTLGPGKAQVQVNADLNVDKTTEK